MIPMRGAGRDLQLAGQAARTAALDLPRMPRRMPEALLMVAQGRVEARLDRNGSLRLKGCGPLSGLVRRADAAGLVTIDARRDRRGAVALTAAGSAALRVL